MAENEIYFLRFNITFVPIKSTSVFQTAVSKSELYRAMKDFKS